VARVRIALQANHDLAPVVDHLHANRVAEHGHGLLCTYTRIGHQGREGRVANEPRQLLLGHGRAREILVLAGLPQCDRPPRRDDELGGVGLVELLEQLLQLAHATRVSSIPELR
jgi:hypothetical protein